MTVNKVTKTTTRTSEETEREVCFVEADGKVDADARVEEDECEEGSGTDQEAYFEARAAAARTGEVDELDPRELGARGEDAAVRYLRHQGFEILERNWTCKFGEADIIALDIDGTLCFIEVKTRRSIAAGIPEEAVTSAKQRRYERIAMCYVMAADWDVETALRFDVIGICVTGEHRALLRHHRGCFDGIF